MFKSKMRKDMTWEQKLEYFKDYYLFRTVCAAGAIAVCVLFVWHFLFRDNEVSLYVAVLNESLDREAAERLQKELEESFGPEGEVIIDDRFYLEGDGLNKLEIYIKNRQIDILSQVRRTMPGYADMASQKNSGRCLAKTSWRNAENRRFLPPDIWTAMRFPLKTMRPDRGK